MLLQWLDSLISHFSTEVQYTVCTIIIAIMQNTFWFLSLKNH